MTTDASGSKTTAARALVDCLLREGIDHVFGIPGTQNLPFLDALRDTPEIRFVLTRHEQGSAFMAYGFARAANRPSVVTATEGPGITNLATGIAAAYKGFVPLISICGQQEERLRDRDASQDIDQVALATPITKWATSVGSGKKMQESARRAFRIALAEPQGPVHIEASRDVFLEETEPEPLEPSTYRALTPADCSETALDEAMAVLSQARRPLIVAGGGVLRESQTAALAELADRGGIPVACLQLSPDAFPTTHSKALGIIGRNGWESANRAAREADVIVAVGAHIDYYSTMFGYGVLRRDAKIIHHSPVATDVGVVYPVAQAVTGSTGSFIAGLTRRVRESGQTWEWLDVAGARSTWETERNAPAQATAPIRGAFVAKAMRNVLPPNGMMVVDAGNAGKHLRPMYDTYEPGTFLMIDDWASVGGSFPIALGAKLARPDRPVMVTVGDMGMMCNIGEMETAVRENIPVVAVVFNDDGLGNERAFQNELYGGRLFAVDYGTVDFGAVARAMGGHGERVTEAAQLEGALHRALDSGKPAIVDVAIDKSFLAAVVMR